MKLRACCTRPIPGAATRPGRPTPPVAGLCRAWRIWPAGRRSSAQPLRPGTGHTQAVLPAQRSWPHTSSPGVGGTSAPGGTATSTVATVSRDS
jgi:hypothetical protein